MLGIATTLLLAVHLLAMNLASAGPLVALWLSWRRDADLEERGQLVSRLLKLSLAALVIGSAIGGLLVLAPNPGLRSALGRFTADAYWFGAAELLFSGACLLALILARRALVRRRWLAGLLVVASATNLLYHFPPWMAVIGELAADSRWAADQLIDRRTLLKLWMRPEVLALWMHFILASLAVAPIATLWLLQRKSRENESESARALANRLGGWALLATVLQVPAGMWMLAATRDASRDSMLGDNVAVSALFAAGVLVALWLMRTLAAIALGEDGAAARRASWLVMAVTVLMTATLRTSRTAAQQHAPRAEVAAAWSVPQK